MLVIRRYVTILLGIEVYHLSIVQKHFERLGERMYGVLVREEMLRGEKDHTGVRRHRPQGAA
jgi:hypothetical protein